MVSKEVEKKLLYKFQQATDDLISYSEEGMRINVESFSSVEIPEQQLKSKTDKSQMVMSLC